MSELGRSSLSFCIVQENNGDPAFLREMSAVLLEMQGMNWVNSARGSKRNDFSLL